VVAEVVGLVKQHQELLDLMEEVVKMENFTQEEVEEVEMDGELLQTHQYLEMVVKVVLVSFSSHILHKMLNNSNKYSYLTFQDTKLIV
jgi:hypothetical protein